MKRPPKMVPVSRNVRTMYEPIHVTKLSMVERIEDMIDEIESDIFKLTGDSPTPEQLENPRVVHLKARLAVLQNKKERAAHSKPQRKRHGAKPNTTGEN